MFYKDEHRSLLEKIDIFGIGINIRFNKKAEHKTKIGGIFSIIIAGLMIYQIQIVYANLVDSSNPTVIQEQKYTDQPQRYDLNQTLFTISFGLQDATSTHFIDPQIYNLTLYYKRQNRVFNENTGVYDRIASVREVQIEPCQPKHFELGSSQDYFLQLDYQNMYCLSLEEDDLYIEGEFDSTNYSTLELLVQSCSQNCKPPDQMFNRLNQGRLAIYFVDYSVIPTNKYNPFQPLGRQVFWTSGPEFTKALKLNFRNTYMESDFGLIGQDLNTQRILTYSYDRDQTTPKLQNIMYDCYIGLEKNIENSYKRSYPKLDRALSQIGGSFNILFAIGALFCKPFSQIELNRKLINRIFSFISKERQNKNMQMSQVLHDRVTKNFQKYSSSTNNLNKQSIFDPILTEGSAKKNNNATSTNMDIFASLQENHLTENLTELQVINTKKGQQSRFRNLHTSIFFDPQNVPSSQQTRKAQTLTSKEFNFKENNITETEELKQNDKTAQKEKEKSSEELAKFFEIQNSSIIFKAWEYFVSIFKVSNFCRNEKQKLIQKGIEKLYNHIDIFYLIQKLLEVEKLKRLLLNENQFKLFEFIPKPVLTMEEKLIHMNMPLAEKVDVLYEDNRNLFEKTIDAQQAFYNITNKQRKVSKLDMRIMEMLDPKFKQLLEEMQLQQNTEENMHTHTNATIINLQAPNEIAEERSSQPVLAADNSEQVNSNQINVTVERSNKMMPYEFLNDIDSIHNETALKVYSSSATKSNQIQKIDFVE